MKPKLYQRMSTPTTSIKYEPRAWVKDKWQPCQTVTSGQPHRASFNTIQEVLDYQTLQDEACDRERLKRKLWAIVKITTTIEFIQP